MISGSNMFPNQLNIVLVQLSDLLKRRFQICSIRSRKVLPYEMAKEKSVVETRLTEWNDRFIKYLPEPIKDRASSAFRSFENKILDLYNNEKVFTPIKEAYNKAYRRS